MVVSHYCMVSLAYLLEGDVALGILFCQYPFSAAVDWLVTKDRVNQLYYMNLGSLSRVRDRDCLPDLSNLLRVAWYIPSTTGCLQPIIELSVIFTHASTTHSINGSYTYMHTNYIPCIVY